MAEVPGGLETTTRTPLDGKYWVNSFNDINKGLVSHGLIRFNKEEEKLWIKLNSGWANIPIGGQSVAGFSVKIGKVTKGPVAKVTNVGTEEAPILDFVLPQGDTGKSATIQIERVENSPDNQPYIRNLGDEVNASYVLQLPRGIKGDRGPMFTINAQGKLSDRSLYNSQAVDFVFLVTEEDHPDNGYIYIKTQTGWSEKIPFKGATGSTGKTIWIAYAQDQNGLGATFTSTSTTKFVSFLESINQPTLGAFTNWRRFVGNDGKDGGPAGDSAYQTYVKNGHPNATEEDFLNSLKGGNGLSAYQIWLSLGNIGTEADFLTSINESSTVTLITRLSPINILNDGSQMLGVPDEAVSFISLLITEPSGYTRVTKSYTYANGILNIDSNANLRVGDVVTGYYVVIDRLNRLPSTPLPPDGNYNTIELTPLPNF